MRGLKIALLASLSAAALSTVSTPRAKAAGPTYMPFIGCTGWMYGNGTSGGIGTPLSCSATIPSSALTGFGTNVGPALQQPLSAASGMLGYGGPTAGLSFTQQGTGAATQTLDAWMKTQCFTFTDFTGADPTDTSFVDTAWTNFSASVISTGRCGRVPAGTYKFQNPAVIDIGSVWQYGATFQGDGVQRTIFDMKTQTTASAAFTLQASAFSGNGNGTFAFPSYGFYLNFLDIGINSNAPGQTTLAIGKPDFTDQLNVVRVRTRAVNSSTSSTAIGGQVNALFGRSFIEGTFGTGGHGDALQVTASSFNMFNVNAGGSDNGIHIYGSQWQGTGHISGNTLTIDSTTYGTPALNQEIFGAGVTNNFGVVPPTPMITGGSGTVWTFSGPSQGTIATEAMSASNYRANTYANTFISQDTEVNNLTDLWIDQNANTAGGVNTFIGGQWNYANGGVGALAAPKAPFANQIICPNWGPGGTVNNISASEPGKIVANCAGTQTSGNQPNAVYITTNGGTASLGVDLSGNSTLATSVSGATQSYATTGTGPHQFFVGATLAGRILSSGIDTAKSYQVNGDTILNAAAPTISSGFGTSPVLTAPAGSTAFRIVVGSGGTASTGVISMGATATNNWVCEATDVSQTTATIFATKQLGQNQTQVTLNNYSAATGAAAAWGAGDVLLVKCGEF